MFHEFLFKLDRLIGRKALAKHCEVSIKIVNNWFTRDKNIRVEHALAIENLTSKLADKNGTKKITAENISPYAAKQIKEFRVTVIREFLKNQKTQNSGIYP